MNKRQHRAAVQAKRGDIDLSRHAGRGYPVDDLTDAECIAIDAAYDRAKTDPAAAAAREHRQITEQQQMLGILRGAV